MVSCGQTIVTVPGQPVPLGNMVIGGDILVKALPKNTKPVVIGNHEGGGFGMDTGYVLDAGDESHLHLHGNISQILVDAEHAGDGVCWIVTDSAN